MACLKTDQKQGTGGAVGCQRADRIKMVYELHAAIYPRPVPDCGESKNWSSRITGANSKK